MYVYTYLSASSCGVASLIVAYSLVVGGLGDLLRSLLPFSCSIKGEYVHD